MHSQHENKPLSKLSSCLVAKTIEGIVGKSWKSKKLSSVDLLVEVERVDQSSALLTLIITAEYKKF